ncbi:class I SAM-dependent methyltransferase [Candidatus Latescibacterota bacterium]
MDARFELAHRLRCLGGRRILDVACGHGVLLSVLREECQPVGVDSSHERLRAARNLTPGGWYVCADVERLHGTEPPSMGLSWQASSST